MGATSRKLSQPECDSYVGKYLVYKNFPHAPAAAPGVEWVELAAFEPYYSAVVRVIGVGDAITLNLILGHGRLNIMVKRQGRYAIIQSISYG